MSTLGIAARIHAANKELGWVEKAGKNKEQNYAFVQAVDIFADVRDALNKHGVVFSHATTRQTITPIDKGNGKFAYLHEVGGTFAYINADDKSDVIAGDWAGSSIDSSDKGTWKAITGGLKYILLANHLLPTGDPENDGEADAKPQSKPTTAQATKVEPPATVHTGLTEKQKALLFARFGEIGLKNTESRRYVLHQLTGKNSTKEMTGDDLEKVLKFFAEQTDATDEMVVKAMAAAK